MTLRHLALLTAIALVGLLRAGAEDLKVRLGGHIRPLWLVQRVDDPYRHKTQLFHFLRTARLSVQAEYRGLSLYSELTLTGREAEIPLSPATNPTWGLNATLLDFYGDIQLPFLSGISVRLGQFKVPFGREQLARYRDMDFVDRTPLWTFIGLGRDVGGALHGTIGDMVDFALAVQTGVGRDVPERFLPEIVEMLPMITLRVGARSQELKTNAFLFPHASAPSGKLTWSIAANALYLKDVLTGHSTVLNVRAKDKPLLLQPVWNPYIARRPLEAGEGLGIGADGMLSLPVEPLQLRLEAEGAWARYKNTYGELSVLGAWVAALVDFDNFTGGIRYAFVRPDTVMGAGISPAFPQPIGDKPITELIPMLSFRFLENRVKLLLEVPIWLDMPVVIEKDVGAYVLLQQWDQLRIVATAGNRVERQNIIGVRAAVQMGF